MSCSSSRSGNRMMAFQPDRQSIRYKGAPKTTYSISGLVKDKLESRPIHPATVELYAEGQMSQSLSTTMTTTRGKFIFTVRPGNYVLRIAHEKFREEYIAVAVREWDVDMNDVKLDGFYE